MTFSIEPLNNWTCYFKSCAFISIISQSRIMTLLYWTIEPLNIVYRIYVHISLYLSWGKLWSTLNCWPPSRHPATPTFPRWDVIHLLIHWPMHWLNTPCPPPTPPPSLRTLLMVHMCFKASEWPFALNHWTWKYWNAIALEIYVDIHIFITGYKYIYVCVSRYTYCKVVLWPHHWTIEPIEHFKSLAIPQKKLKTYIQIHKDRQKRKDSFPIQIYFSTQTLHNTFYTDNNFMISVYR